MTTLAERMHLAMAHRKSLAAPGETVNQATIAAACRIRQPSVNDWFSGKTKSLRGDTVLLAAKYLFVRAEWLSNGTGEMAYQPRALEQQPAGYGTEVVDDRDSVRIPKMAVAGSMGNGTDRPTEDVVTGTLSVSSTWARRELHIPDSRIPGLRFITGYGDSMRPTFISGDVLLVDTGVRTVDVDGIYVLASNQDLFIKRVTRRLDGVHEITSDNPLVRQTAILNGDHHVDVLGRVLYVWNGRKV